MKVIITTTIRSYDQEVTVINIETGDRYDGLRLSELKPVKKENYFDWANERNLEPIIDNEGF